MSTVAISRRPAVQDEIFEGFPALRLAAGELQALFVPSLGMVGASLLHAGEELLDRRDGLGAYRDTGAVMGIPLLHPWANRLAGEEYSLHGRHVRLSETGATVRRDEQGLPIHGLVGAYPGWEVAGVRLDDRAARLRARLDFSADPRLDAAFPFRHEVVIDAALTADALTIATTVRATGGAPVPLSFGFHPYLQLPGVDRERWVVLLPRRRRLELDGRGLPTGRAARRPATRLRLGDRAFDHAYDRLADGAAFAISGAGRTISVVHHRGYAVAQVYSPAGAPFICFEPMSAPVNALRTGAGLARVMPGASATAAFSIRVLVEA